MTSNGHWRSGARHYLCDCRQMVFAGHATFTCSWRAEIVFCSGASVLPRRIQGFRSSLLGVRVCSCLPHYSLNTIFQHFLAQKKAIYIRHLQDPSAWNSCWSFSTVSFNPVSEPAIRSSSRGLSFHPSASRTCHAPNCLACAYGLHTPWLQAGNPAKRHSGT